MAKEKQEIIQQLNKIVSEVIRFIQEKLPGDEAGRKLWAEIKEILEDYQESGDMGNLSALNEIRPRAVPEGAPADYTLTTKVKFEDKYISLHEYLQKIDDLIAEYREI